VAGSAQVAQLVEHATENRSVGGSIPPLGTMQLLSGCLKANKQNQWLDATRLVQKVGTMPLAMSRPWKHPNSGVFWLRKGVPEDLRKIVGKREEKRSP
jgi:hypothetical protein